MNYGFIYCLGNDAMPGIYKIGMTERSPTQRSIELSGPTGVPLPFKLMCYGEVQDPAQAEREVHECFAEYRVNAGREFFRIPYEHAYSTIRELCESFADTEHSPLQLCKEMARQKFLSSGSVDEKVAALLEWAREECIRLYTRDGKIVLAGSGSKAYPIEFAVAISLMKHHLLNVLPTSKPDCVLVRLGGVLPEVEQ